MKRFYLTQQRLAILRLLHRVGSLTADQILCNISTKYPPLTFKKFLDELVGFGLLEMNGDRYAPGNGRNYHSNRVEILEILASSSCPLKGSEIDRQLSKPMGITNIGALLERMWMDEEISRDGSPYNYRFALMPAGVEILRLLGRDAA